MGLNVLNVCKIRANIISVELSFFTFNIEQILYLFCIEFSLDFAYSALHLAQILHSFNAFNANLTISTLNIP